MAWVMDMGNSLVDERSGKEKAPGRTEGLGGVMVGTGYVMGAMVVCGWALMLPMGLRLVLPPCDVRGQGNDDGCRGRECAGQDCDLNRHGTQFGKCSGGDCDCEKWYEHGIL